ncbi:MAG: Holliday junction resolvase RuvX [Phycisphaerales bacterium]|jgi:putative Holliday junction resolvase
MKYLAIDYGQKRTGLALCDPDETICSPLAVLETNKNLISQILKTIETEKIEAVVVGLPLNMDGTKGPQAKTTENFTDQLKKQLDIPLHFCDERLSSFAAREKFAAAEIKGSKKKKPLDAVAAAEILQSFLDSKKHNGK